jgi:hypothetical protein
MKLVLTLLFLLAAPLAQAQTPFACCAQVCTPVTGQDQPLVFPIATFTIVDPVIIDQLIGTLTIVNGPVSAMTIVCGDSGNPTNKPPGYFEVWPLTEHIRTTDIIGSSLPPSGVYNLMVSATNAAGTTVAPVTVIVP